MEDLLMIFGAIWGILSIVLFFKLWGMTNDVKELKEFTMNSNQKGSPQTPKLTKDDIIGSLEVQQKEIIVTWNHKYNIGDSVIYKNSGKKICIAQVLEKEREYRCLDLDTNQLLSAIFYEDELIKDESKEK